MARKSTPKTQFKIYLLKESVNSAADAERDISDDEINTKIVRRDLTSPFEGVLLTRPSLGKKPGWIKPIEKLVDEEVNELRTSTASALIILKTAERWFALSYGYGASLLDLAKVERRFGLKVVLNIVDDEKVRAYDSHTIEETTFMTRKQASRSSDVSAFAIDTEREFLKGVTGVPREERFGQRVTGADSLTLSLPIELSKFPELAIDLLAAYTNSSYKQGRFAWIDHLQVVSDSEMKEKLNLELDDALLNNEIERMHLAPPENLEWTNVSGFYYWNPENALKHDELDVGDALKEIGENTRLTTATTVDYLRSRPLWVEYRDGSPVQEGSILSSLVFEVELDDGYYVLSGGSWYEINRGWADFIRSNVCNIPDADIDFPKAKMGECEECYNKRAARRLNACNLDQCLVQFGETKDKFEVCDILTKDKKLVHVKRKMRSATLSHLFNQGLHSAMLLRSEDEFRKQANEKAKDRGMDIEDLIPLKNFLPEEYEIVFAIISKPDRSGKYFLPFFSQLSLYGAKRELNRYGYKVSKKFVDLLAE